MVTDYSCGLNQGSVWIPENFPKYEEHLRNFREYNGQNLVTNNHEDVCPNKLMYIIGQKLFHCTRDFTSPSQF